MTYIAGWESKFLAKNLVQLVALGMVALEAVNWEVSGAASGLGLACALDAAGISLHFQEGCLCSSGSYLPSVTEHDEILGVMRFVMFYSDWFQTYPVHLGI